MSCWLPRFDHFLRLRIGILTRCEFRACFEPVDSIQLREESKRATEAQAGLHSAEEALEEAWRDIAAEKARRAKLEKKIFDLTGNHPEED